MEAEVTARALHPVQHRRLQWRARPQRTTATGGCDGVVNRRVTAEHRAAYANANATGCCCTATTTAAANAAAGLPSGCGKGGVATRERCDTAHDQRTRGEQAHDVQLGQLTARHRRGVTTAY